MMKVAHNYNRYAPFKINDLKVKRAPIPTKRQPRSGEMIIDKNIHLNETQKG